MLHVFHILMQYDVLRIYARSAFRVSSITFRCHLICTTCMSEHVYVHVHDCLYGCFTPVPQWYGVCVCTYVCANPTHSAGFYTEAVACENPAPAQAQTQAFHAFAFASAICLLPFLQKTLHHGLIYTEATREIRRQYLHNVTPSAAVAV